MYLCDLHFVHNFPTLYENTVKLGLKNVFYLTQCYLYIYLSIDLISKYTLLHLKTRILGKIYWGNNIFLLPAKLAV